MKINDILYGFRIKSVNEIAEVCGNLYLMEHEKSGAKLVFLQREDNNKTFAIAFRTPPEDDTGVFHVIEHSVLCGSKRFPVKEPFVELLKGSLNTFLNAITYEDRTVYPVSSRCDKDFLNLTEVYLDAVFHPLVLENESIFLQEGWHTEYDENSDSLSYNGVVFNEMKGAYSSPDDLGGAALSRALFPNSPYGKDSGGDPEAIPSLTYAQLCACHKKYYHPSNSYVFLDGSVNLDDTLPLIDSYLSEYERAGIEVSLSPTAPFVADDVIIKYEIPESENEQDRYRLLLGYAFADCEKQLDSLGAKLICDAVAGSNEAPLCKALLDRGLCEDVLMYTNNSRQSTAVIEIRGAREENLDKIKETVENTLRTLCTNGIDKSLLTAPMNRIEFKAREMDFGALPRGVAFALSVFGVWLYGIAPEEALRYENTLAALRERINSRYFEDLLLGMTVDCPHRACVIMVPDKLYGKTVEGAIAQKTAALRKSMSDEELSAIKEKEQILKNWQSTPDSPEATATLPTLSISDINPEPSVIPTEEDNVSGVRTIYHTIPTGGITYVRLFFDASDLSAEEISLLPILAALFKNLPTKKHTAIELQSYLKLNTGSFTITPGVFEKNDGSGNALLYFGVSASALDTKVRLLPELIGELLLTTDFSDKKTIETLLGQLRAEAEDSFSSSEQYALSRAIAGMSVSGAIREHLSGIEAYKNLKSTIANFKINSSEFSAYIADFANRLFTKSRLILSIVGATGREIAKQIIDVFPNGTPAGSIKIKPMTKQNEGIAIPARTAYAALGAFSADVRSMIGTLRVVRSILSYEHLWNTVRVQGGAYGTGFAARRSGIISFYSYRDPSPFASVKAFYDSPDYLRRIAEDRIDLTKFVIGAFGDYDVLLSPRMAAAQATYDLLSGWSLDDERKVRADMLSVSPKSLLAAAELIENAAADGSVCISAAGDRLCGENSIALTLIEI